MATATKRQSPPTHPTVWVGLGLAAVGLLLAMYAYSGTRIYDVRFAIVALVGGVFALSGILTAAWGRAVMAARASRSKRQLIAQDAMKLAEATEAPPTVAEPPSKKRFDFRASARRILPQRGAKEERPVEAAPAGRGALFAFKRPASPAPEAPPAEPEPVAARPADAAPVKVTLRCPHCSTQFSAQGQRPLTATCPSCGFSAEV